MSPPRFAILVAICFGRDKRNNPPINQVHRVTIINQNLKIMLSAPGMHVDTVLMTSGFPDDLLAQGDQSAFNRRVDVPQDDLHWYKFGHKRVEGRMYPCEGRVQKRDDGRCTSLKLHAWNLTEYDGILAFDSDACLIEDPRPYLMRQYELGTYFAHSGREKKPTREGFNSHLFYFQPSRILYKLLTDMARLGDYYPFTNGEQDVLETVFPVHLPNPAPPKNKHRVGSLLKMSHKCNGLPWDHPEVTRWRNISGPSA